jgi:hypothetical protein
MKTINSFIFFFCGCTLLFSLQGCSPPFYAFGNNVVDPIVFNKPLYADSIKQTTYIGGKYNFTPDSANSHKNEKNYFGQLYLAQTHIARNYNYSYGVFGYIGSYKVAELENYNGNKSYYGGGLSCEFNYNIPIEDCDIHPFGIKGTLLYENGDFSRFRQMAAQQNLITGVSASQFAYNISFTQGIDFIMMKGRLGINVSEGSTRFVNDYPEILTISMDVHYTYKQFTFFIQQISADYLMDNGISLGMNYRLNYK